VTEAQFLVSDDPDAMVACLRKGVHLTDRKAVLAGAACCRRVWPMLADGRLRAAVEAAEGYAGGPLEWALRPHMLVATEVSAGHYRAAPVEFDRDYVAWRGAKYAAEAVLYTLQRGKLGTALGMARKTAGDIAWLAGEGNGSAAQVSEAAAQEGILREVFGNPFRPATLDRAALTPTVASLAQAAYENRSLPSGHLDPARLAVLSDALEEAGCTDADLLSHLRSPGPHVRGCWALDLILGRS
jgi:hypothetical protein